jgi:acetyltransferase-like isoleucine patch superfamily enzyme
MFGIGIKIRMLIFKVKWRKHNPHNMTIANNIFSIQNVTVGKKTYGELNVNLGTNPIRKIEIGNFCSIAPNVSFIINPHNYKFFSTWGWQRFEYNELEYNWEKKTKIVVEDDVWIGQGAIILGGATLHQGCVIGAGSVVSCNVPPYAIFAGSKVIKYRFNPEICEKLLSIDYKKIDANVINNIQGWHKKEIDETNIDLLLKELPLKKNMGENE